MTTYTITTTQNVTTLAAKAGGDTYTINGGTLVIDCDSRYGPNQGALTGYLGSVTISSTLGGSVVIDGTKVRLIPFSSGTGTVPAAGTTITQGSVTSELLGVWSAINTTPTAAAAAMPASGFLKVRNVSGGAGVYAAGALTGIGASAVGADIVGWIEVIGKETQSILTPRIGTCTTQGAWMSPFDTSGVEVKTSGVAGQTIQLPASVGNTYYAGCYVESAPGSGVYIRWGNASDLVNANLATDERGRFCWISATGVLRFGSDGTNTVGLVPPSGCRIRVPNILLGSTNSTVGFGANSLPNTAVATRFTFSGNSTGIVNIDKANVAWGINNLPCYAMTLTNSTFVTPFALNNMLTGFTLTNSIFSQRDSAGTVTTSAVGLNSYVPGANASDNLFTQCTMNNANAYMATVSLVGGTFNRNRAHCFTVSTLASPVGPYSLTLNASTADANEAIGGCAFGGLTMVAGSKLTNTKVCCWAYGTSVASAPNSYLWSIGNFQNSVIDGLTWLLSTTDTCAPAGQWAAFPPLAVNAKIRNIGAAGSPLDAGQAHPPSVMFGSAFQAVINNCALQRIYTTATTANIVGEAVQNTAFHVENCALPSPSVTLYASNSNVRGWRVTNLPAASGTAAGIHWGDFFTSDTVGSINVFMTDAASTTADQVAVTAGTPKFNGGPGLITATVGDQVTWTMRYFAQGHTALGAPVMTGGTIGNYLVEFRVDVNDGNGWSAWATANAGNLAAVTINPTLGVKLALRITCLTASTTAITGLRIPTSTTLAAQQAISYPLDPVTISVTNIVAGSRIKVIRTDTSVVLDNALVSGTSYSLTGDYTGIPVQVEVRCATPPGPYYQPWVGSGTVLSTGLAFQALQVRDDQ